MSYFELTKLQFVIDYSRDQMYSTSILVTFTTNLKAVFVGFMQDLIIKIPEWWICYIKEYFDLYGIMISLLFKILGVSGFFSIEVEHFVVIKYFLITRKNWKNLISSMFCQHHFKPSLAVMVSALPVHILKTFFSLLWK